MVERKKILNLKNRLNLVSNKIVYIVFNISSFYSRVYFPSKSLNMCLF